MVFAKDSPVAYKVVPAPDNWTRNGAAVRAITIHMAEGGGTVSWLTRNDGNSSHYVIEYDGGVVQMVDEERAAGSVNPKMLRTTNDTPFTYLGERIVYGRTAANAALGTGVSDPNRYIIAFEVEGYAANGPNAAQRVALKKLIADIRRRKGALPVVCHRDFQAYKACPGHKIPWVDYGGHGKKVKVPTVPTTPPPTGDTPVAIQGSSVPEVPTRVWLRDDPTKAGKSRWLYTWSDHRADKGNTQMEPNRWVLLTRFIDADTYAVAYEPAAGDTNSTSQEMFVHSGDILKTEPVPQGDPAAIAKAVADATASLNQKIAQMETLEDAIAANLRAEAAKLEV